MASGSNLDMLPILGDRQQESSGNLVDSLQSELELMLQARRKQLLINQQMDLNMYRSGSAPPTMEGSLRAVGGLFGNSNVGTVNNVSNGGSDSSILTEDEIRSHLPYLSYYYSHENINPRLPPPLLSKEDWRAVQRFQAGGSSIGAIGDLWKKKFSGDGENSSLFDLQPGLSLPQLENGLIESRNINVSNNCMQTSADWLGKGSDALREASGLGSRRKSFANILQEGLDRPASLSDQLSRPASNGALGDIVNTIGISDSHSPDLSNGTDILDGFHSRAAPPGFGGGQSHHPTISPPFASAVGSSLSRSATPEQHLVGRSNSPVLPPVGSRIGPIEKKNVARSTVQNGYHDGMNEPSELAATLSGLNLSQTGQVDEDSHMWGLLRQEFLFDMSNGHCKNVQPQLMGKPNFDNLSLPAHYSDVARKNGIIQRNNVSEISSNGAINFPKRTSSYANLRSAVSSSSFGSLERSNGHRQNANVQRNDLISNGHGSALDGSGIGQNLNLNMLENQVRSNLHSQLMDPSYSKFLQRSDYGSAASSNGSHAKNYFVSTLGDLDGIEKVYFEALLAQQKNQYELPQGKYGSSKQGNYRNSSYDLGVLGNLVADSVLAPSGYASLKNDQAARFSAMMRNSRGGSTGMWNSDISNNVEKRHGSALLDEFKNNKTRSFELADIVGHVVEFSMDQFGSRFIQQKLESASVEEKNKIFPEIIPHARTLMTDVFGNYVIQKFFEHGTESQRTELAGQLTGHVLPLSLQMYGCRVIQKALEVVDVDQQTQMVAELDGSIMNCVRDQNGNHVIQKSIECVPEDRIRFIILAFYGQVVALSTHSYGCRVIQRVLEHCHDMNTHQIIMEEIMQSVCTLAQDQYGNYVIQHVLEHGKPDERSAIIRQLAGQIVKMSQQKFASNVVEKCLTFGGPEERQLLVKEMLGTTDENEPLQMMMKDPYGNYVVQKVLETCNSKSVELLLSRIKVHLTTLKRYTYGKHIVSRVEKLITTGEKRIGLSSSQLS